MKFVQQLFCLAGIASMSFLAACDKEKNNPTTSGLNDLFNDLRSTPQIFTVTAGSTQTIEGAAGTIITFFPNSFIDASGTPLSSGLVEISLTEVYTPAQMIAHRTNTITNDDRMLTSGGHVLLTASYNGTELSAGQYELAFRQPEANESPMALFYGQLQDGTVIWDSDTSNTVDRTIKDSTNSGTNAYYYWFDSCTNFGWVNCDYFYTAPDPKSDIFVTMPDATFDATNTQVFVVFPEINMVSGTYMYEAASNTFSFGSPGYFLPIGTTIQVVVLSDKNNQAYMQVFPSLSVTQDLTINYVPEAATVADIQAALADL